MKPILTTKTVKVYTCPHCEDDFSSKSEVVSHIDTCKLYITKANATQKLKAELSDIQKTSKSVHEFIVGLVDAFAKVDVHITFTEYPSSYGRCSNSHSSPKGYKTCWGEGDLETPKYYPGWHGIWKGHITIGDGNPLNFDKFEMSTISQFIPAVKTGSGRPGQNFEISGVLFLYDFDAMHEEYLKSGKLVTTYCQEYEDTVKRYFERYDNLKNTVILNNDELKEISNLILKLNKYKDQLNGLQTKYTSHLTAEFNKNYGIKFPTPPSAFLKVNEKYKTRIQETQTYPTHDDTNIHNELKVLVESVNNQIKVMSKYIDRFPENFV